MVKKIDYDPKGSHKLIWDNKEKQFCAYGPAGTGKTRAILEKLHAICDNFKNVRVLIMRKTRDSLNESVLETYENEVLPEGHYCKTGTQRRIRQKYTYPNGSEIVLGGLDNSSKVLSSRYDLIYVPEAIEVSEDDVETLMTRLRAYNFHYRQLIMDTNPGGYEHWLYKKWAIGELTMIKSDHRDNPLLYDEYKQEWTEEGQDYVIGILSKLTGRRRQKYYIGEWGFVDGIVYSDFNPQKAIIPRFDFGTRDIVYCSTTDFGFNDPFFHGIWAHDQKSNDVFLTNQIYYSRRLVSEHIKTIRMIYEEYGLEGKVKRGIFDHDLEKTEQICSELKLKRILADKKSISDNIDTLSTILSQVGTDNPSIYIFEDSLYEVDDYLRDEKKWPTCLQEEFPVYTWKKDNTGSTIQDVPIDKFNHGINGTEYLARYIYGNGSRRRRFKFFGD